MHVVFRIGSTGSSSFMLKLFARPCAGRLFVVVLNVMAKCKKCGGTDFYKCGKCKDCLRIYVKNWREANPESYQKHNKRTHPRRWDTAEYRKRHSQWRDDNRDVYLAKKARYRARKRNACPAWLTQEQHAEIQVFYTEAVRLTRETGVPHQVDHIVPLGGSTVCGLHVPWNLQVITAKENLRKSNRVPPVSIGDP